VANEQRVPIDYFSTALLSQLTISGTTMQSADFVNLPTDYSASRYLPLVLHDDSLGVYEIVWITGHTSGSNTVTIARGKEGSSPQPWAAGSRVECAPSQYDRTVVRTSGSMPSDPWIGMRVERSDKSDVVQWTGNQWAPAAGMGLASDQNPNMHAVSPPDGAVFTIRAGTATGTTSASGLLSCTFRTPFPNGCLGIAPVSTFFNASGILIVSAVRTTGADVSFLKGDGSRLASATASYAYVAFGW
jgi:hypothetical protein